MEIRAEDVESTASTEKLSILRTLATHLTRSETYSFYALICTLVVFFGMGAMGYGAIADNNTFMLLGGAMNILAIVGALIVIAIVEKGSTSRLTPAARDEGTFPARNEDEIYGEVEIPDEQIRSALASVSRSLRKASRVTNQTFRKAILARLGPVTRDADRWANATVHDSVNQRRLIVDLYRHAKASVFSASTQRDDDEVWKGDFGDDILKAHEEARARDGVAVTRVFVFDNRDEITEARIENMKKQQEGGIDVRVYIDKEDLSYEFNTERRKGFVVIDDGEVIGVVQSTEPVRLIRWTFENEARKAAFKVDMDVLLDGGKTLRTFLADPKPAS